MEHPDPEINRALIKLCDALCQWERSTGRQSVLILREEGGFVSRTANGVRIPDDVADQQILQPFWN